MNRITTLTAAVALAVPAIASANLITNGSFEADMVDGFEVAPTGASSVQSGVTTEIVTGAGVTDGSQALRISSPVTNSGAYSAVVYLFTPSDDLFTVGQEYDVSGDVTFVSGSNAYINIIDYDNSTGDNFGNPMSTNVITNAGDTFESLDTSFVYRGGNVALQLQVDNYTGTGEAVGIFDNLSITVVPEPTSAAALGLLGLTALRRRGR